MLTKSSILHSFKKRIRMVRVKLLVCPHQGNEVFGFGQIDNVVRPTGDYVNSFDFVAQTSNDTFSLV